MMRSLWTAASGMTNQMLQIDNIANNLSNVNTTGFKRERVDFQTLLYTTMRRADLDPVNMTGRPVNLQVGHGVRASGTTRLFEQGPLQTTGLATDFAIEGRGFFEVRRNFDEFVFTRDGTFSFMPLDDDSLMLTTSSGYPVMDIDGAEIIIPPGISASDVVISDMGEVSILDFDGTVVPLGFIIRIVQFPNPQGLEAIGGNLYTQTVASGIPLFEIEGETGTLSRIRQGFLEMSNVSVAGEMISMITAQRAFDLNSRAITTSDEMLQTANSLKR